MKKILLILLLLPLLGIGQNYVYRVDTLYYDSTNNEPLVGGIVRLNINSAQEKPIYAIFNDGIAVYHEYRVMMVNAGLITRQVKAMWLSAADNPAIYNYLTNQQVRDTINARSQMYIDSVGVFWGEYFNLIPE